MHDHHHHHDGHHHHGGHHHHHDQSHAAIGHNHAHVDIEHLRSHLHNAPKSSRIEELRTLAEAFIEGFRNANDKTSFLRLAGVPFSRPGEDGLAMHLVDVAIGSNWQVGTASPAFASRELVYMPYPGNMVSERETMTFTYVSLTGRDDIDLFSILEEI